jgi:hypothetical protein
MGINSGVGESYIAVVADCLRDVQRLVRNVNNLREVAFSLLPFLSSLFGRQVRAVVLLQVSIVCC